MFDFLVRKFDFLTGNPPSPTRDWPPGDGRPLIANLDEGTLNGAPVDGPLERLSFLGREEDPKAARREELLYFSKGLGLEYDRDDLKIFDFRIVIADPYEPRFRPFAGTVIADGREIDLPSLTMEECARQLGVPYWADADEREFLLFYEREGREWQFEFDLRERLTCVYLPSAPLMAEEGQRLLYNVTKPWPPEDV